MGKVSFCTFYADGEHAWEAGFKRQVSEYSESGWATLEAEHLASDFSFKGAKRCACGMVVYQRDTPASPFEVILGTYLR